MVCELVSVFPEYLVVLTEPDNVVAPDDATPVAADHLKALRRDGVIESAGYGLYAYVGERRLPAPQVEAAQPGPEGGVRRPFIGPFGITPW